MKTLLVCVSFLLLLGSCTQTKTSPDSTVLIDADLAFSDYSVKHGMQKAFVEFADDSVVLLKPHRMPIVGKQSLIESYQQKSDSGFVLSWKPAKAVLANSGELGYTYGFWKLRTEKDSSVGTYISVWKKTGSGQWKYVIDSGNEGLE